jgi:hypothetical protein
MSSQRTEYKSPEQVKDARTPVVSAEGGYAGSGSRASGYFGSTTISVRGSGGDGPTWTASGSISGPLNRPSAGGFSIGGSWRY